MTEALPAFLIQNIRQISCAAYLRHYERFSFDRWTSTSRSILIISPTLKRFPFILPPHLRPTFYLQTWTSFGGQATDTFRKSPSPYFEMVLMPLHYLSSGFHNIAAKPPTFLSLSRTTLTSGRAGVSEKSARNR